MDLKAGEGAGACLEPFGATASGATQQQRDSLRSHSCADATSWTGLSTESALVHLLRLSTPEALLRG